MAEDANLFWTDGELASAVEAYVYLLRVERAGLPFATEAMSRTLLGEQLRNRNEASLRYRMRNISAVLEEMGRPILKVFSPAEQVGTNVKLRIRSMLQRHPGLQEISKPNSPHSTESNRAQGKEQAIKLLDGLRVSLNNLERELLGIGHNNPPEPLSNEGLRRSDFQDARASIEALKAEIQKNSPNIEAASEHSQALIQVGLRIMAWVGERATKFTDAALKVLAPVVVLQATGVANDLVEVIRAVFNVLSH